MKNSKDKIEASPSPGMETPLKETVRGNIHTAYSLHDMTVIAFECIGNNMTIRTNSGVIKAAPPVSQPEGSVVFHAVQWDFSYAYLLDFAGNAGTFTGEKMFLKDFISRFTLYSFTVMDETYGYNSTKYSGYLNFGQQLCECMIEICHEGDMVFVTNEYE